jgi:hypothetical protein
MKRVQFVRVWLILILLFAVQASEGANLYWYGNTSTTFSTASNWSTVNTGYTAAGAAPGSSDVANFGNYTGMTTANCSLTGAINIQGINLVAGYAGTITQGANTITIGSSGAVLSAGTFSGGSSNITVSGVFTLSGCSFTSTSATLTLTSTYTKSSGTFTHNSGLVYFNPGGSKTYTGSTTFYQIEFNPTANGTSLTFASGTTFTTTDLTVSGTHQTTFIGTGVIDVKGNITVSNTVSTLSSAPLITITGTGSQHIYGVASGSAFPLPNVTVNKSSDTLHLHDFIYVAGDWTRTSGVIDAGTSTVGFCNILTITGTFSLYNVDFDGQNNYTYTLTSATLTVNGDLSLTYNNSGGYVRLFGGTIHAKGNVFVNNTTNTNSTFAGGTTIILIDGTGSQTLTGSTTAGAGLFPTIRINKSSGTLTLANTISVGGNWTYTTGTVSVGTSCVYFINTKTITLTLAQSLKRVTFSAATTATFTLTGASLTVDSTLIITGAGVFTFTGDTIHAQGNITDSNSGNGGSGTTTILIDGAVNQTLTGNSTAGDGRLPDIIIRKTSGTLTLASTISVTGDWTWTTGTISAGSSTLYFISTKTISGTHALNNVTFDGSAASTYTIGSGNTLTVKGTLATNGASAVTLNTGTIHAQGDITVTNSATGASGTASIVINGSGTQTLTGSGMAGQGRLPAITIDKTTGDLFLASVISVYGGWNYLQGKVDADANLTTVNFYGTFNVDAQGSGGWMSFYNMTIAGGSTTLTGTVGVLNDLTINSSTTLSAGSNVITVGGNWNSQGTWTYGTSSVTFNGSGYKQITGVSGSQVNFYDVVFNKSTTLSSLRLSKPVKINHGVTLTQGHIKTDTINYLEFADNATLTGGGDNAYVHGPVRKTGNDAFVFPLGDTLYADTAAYHPLAMTAPSSTGDKFQATYFATTYTVGDSLVDSLSSVSRDEYWKFERKAGSSNVYLTLGWNRNSGSAEDLNVLRIANWNGVKWLDLGAASITASGTYGTVTGSVLPSFNSNVAHLTFGKKKISVPYAVLKKKLDGGYYQEVNGSLYFKFDEEYNDADGILHFNIYDSQNIVATSDQLIDPSIQPLVSYGDNRYKMNTLHCQFSPSGSLPNGVYILEVINEKNEHWYLRFKQTTTISYTCFTPPIPQ